MSIQQAFNNMLMSAQFGAGLYAHSPAGQERFQKKQEDKTYESIQQAKKELQKQYAEGLDEKTTPEEYERIKRVFEREHALVQNMFEREPAKYEDLYYWTDNSLQNIKEGNLSREGFERTALKKLKEKTDTKIEQKKALPNRFKTVEEGVKTAQTRAANKEKWREQALPGGNK